MDARIIKKLTYRSRSRSRSPRSLPSSLRARSLSGSSLPECRVFTSGPPLRVPPRPPPSRRGSQPLTVRPRSTSTRTRRESIFLPSACLYAARKWNHRIMMAASNHTQTHTHTHKETIKSTRHHLANGQPHVLQLRYFLLTLFNTPMIITLLLFLVLLYYPYLLD